MGTIGHYNTTVAEVKERIIKSLDFRTPHIQSFCIASTANWALQGICHLDTGISEIIPVWLNVYRSGDMVCEKVMDATVHPYRYDCPKAFIALTKQHTPNLSGLSQQWFEEWLERSASEKQKIILKVEFGKTYTLTNGKTVLIQGEYNRNNWIGYVDGFRCKIKKRLIAA